MKRISCLFVQTRIISIPLFFSIGIALLFYPGFMSYDTLHALRGARNGVTDSIWPPMVSYVWRVIDGVSHNPSAMHVSQVFLLLVSIFSIMMMTTKKVTVATVFLIAYLSIPVILGTLAVIWKDVLMAAFFMASFALTLYIQQLKNQAINGTTLSPKYHFYVPRLDRGIQESRFEDRSLDPAVKPRDVGERLKIVPLNPAILILLSLVTVLLLFLGVCSRHNAIFAAVPLIFFLIWTLRGLLTTRYVTVSVLLFSATLTGAIFFTKIQLDHYSLPTLTRMNSNQDTFLLTVRALDIAGASVCLGHSLFSAIAPSVSLDDIKHAYDPKHINLSLNLLNNIPIDKRLNQIWLHTAFHHPVCFLYHKAHLSQYLLGLNHGAPFLITAPAIDNNEYGYQLAHSRLRDAIVAGISHASQYTCFKPWFLYLMTLVVWMHSIWKKKGRIESNILMLSAFLYLMSLIIFGNAADARLPFYTTTALFIVIFISIDWGNELSRPHKIR